MEESRKEQRAAAEESEALRALPRRILPVPKPVAKAARAEEELHPPSAVIERLAGHYSRRMESPAVSGKAIEACTKKDFDCRIVANMEYYKVGDEWKKLTEKFTGAVTRAML